MGGIAGALGITPESVGEHFCNPRFDAWFDVGCDRFLASAQVESTREVRRAGDGGQLPHFVEFGW